MPRKKIEAKIVKAAKEYHCLTCNKIIVKGQKHLVFIYRSDYLKKAFEKLTKFHIWIKIFEAFISLRFCSNKCYRLWTKFEALHYFIENSKPVEKRLRALERTALERRFKNWKDWKTWQEIFRPFDSCWRVENEDE